ncbi:MAG: peptide chain release factor N(5)-glutamine methyltransferase [Candidatus Caenarcaniphilales bacterium]|nr:peptide chain release factor N(5)-glutamine methyltransferase [Candidatus Caenarcaniphilales bacterium]
MAQKLSLEPFETEAEINKLLNFVFGFTREQLELKADYQPNLQERKQLFSLLRQRLSHIPLQHLTGMAEFYGLSLKVNKHVLIPRPETEILVEETLKILQNTISPKILEIGTGSGCISLALAKFLKRSNPQITATDISVEALHMAKENTVNLGLEKYINFVQADMVTEELLKTNFDILVSNPPYISHAEFQELAPEVQKEPYLALVGGSRCDVEDDGLTYYKKIANLRIKSKSFLLELDSSRAEAIGEIFKQAGYLKISFIKDLNGFIRFIYFEA